RCSNWFFPSAISCTSPTEGGLSGTNREFSARVASFDARIKVSNRKMYISASIVVSQGIDRYMCGNQHVRRYLAVITIAPPQDAARLAIGEQLPWVLCSAGDGHSLAQWRSGMSISAGPQSAAATLR